MQTDGFINLMQKREFLKEVETSFLLNNGLYISVQTIKSSISTVEKEKCIYGYYNW